MNSLLLRARCRPVPSVVYTLCRGAQSSAQNDHLALFREMNRLASEGKWDNINNTPKKWFGSNREAYAIYHKMVGFEKEYFKRTPYGMYLKALWRTFLYVGGIWACVAVYEFVVPEEYRLAYKYRNKHHPVEEHH